jgi:hypothetical protein
MARKGNYSLVVTDEVVLTELAFEKADRLGVKLVQSNQTPPSAPVRPYLSQPKQKANLAPSIQGADQTSTSDLSKRIHDAVIARLGTQVDPVLLDSIIKRVLNNVGVK